MKSPQQPSNLRQKAVKSIVWSAIESWGRQAVSLVIFFALARLLDPVSFGLVALASIFIAFVQIFVEQGFSTAIIQRQEIDAEHLNTAFWTTLGISAFLTISSIACAGFIADLFHQPQILPIIKYLSLTFLFTGLSSVQQAVLERRFEFKSLALRSLIGVIGGGIVGVVMGFLGFGVWSLVGQQLTSSLMQVLILWRVSNWRPGLKVSAKHFKELFAFGVNVAAFNILTFFSRRSDDLLIGYFLGPVALGYYSVAYRVLLVMTEVLISTTTKVALPIFSRLQKEPQQLKNAFYKATQYVSLIAFPLFLCIPVLAPELIKVVFGEKWNQSIPVIQILSFIGPVHVVLFYHGSVITAMGKPSWRLWIQVIHTVANVIAFVLVVRLGIVAVASAYVIRSYVLLPISILVVKKLIQINLIYCLRLYVIPLFASSVMMGCMLAIKNLLATLIGTYLLLGVLFLFGMVVYVLTLFVISPNIFKKVLDLIKNVNIKIDKE